MNQLLPKIKSLFGSLLVLISIILLSGFALFTLIKQVNSLRSQISSIKTTNNQLLTKIDNLRSIQTQLSDSATTDVITALPSQNPSLLIMSQLRRQAIAGQLVISDLKISSSSPPAEGLSSVSVDFSLLGQFDQILSFVENLPRLLPIMTITNAEIDQKNELYEATINLRSSWSPLPESLPPVTQPITGLSPSEQATILELSQYIHPSLLPFSSLAPTTPEPRSNPFAPSEETF